MFNFFRQKLTFYVQLELNGRHPYLKENELDFFAGKRPYVIQVKAYDWNDAEKQGFEAFAKLDVKCWSYTVIGIERDRG